MNDIENLVDEFYNEERKMYFACGKGGVIEMEIATTKAALLYGKNELSEEDEELLKNKRKRLEESVEEGLWSFNGLEWKYGGVTGVQRSERNVREGKVFEKNIN
jgi:hypothetical protein